MLRLFRKKGLSCCEVGGCCGHTEYALHGLCPPLCVHCKTRGDWRMKYLGVAGVLLGLSLLGVPALADEAKQPVPRVGKTRRSHPRSGKNNCQSRQTARFPHNTVRTAPPEHTVPLLRSASDPRLCLWDPDRSLFYFFPPESSGPSSYILQSFPMAYCSISAAPGSIPHSLGFS